MDADERSKEGQIQLVIEYGSQHGQLQVHILEINNLILPAVKRLGLSHIYVKSHLLSEKTKEILKNKGSVIGYFLPDASKESKRKTEEVKLTLSCHSTRDGAEETKNNEKSRKSKLRAALQKQRERFRLRRNSDKVKTVVNAAGEDNGRATISFERPLYYPSVSLYQLQTHSLHLTICGRNVSTTRSYPIATTCIPLMIAIKQHHPTWYPLQYNPDLTTGSCPQEANNFVKDSWEKVEGGAYTGRSLAWNMSETKEPNHDNWFHKRKDYSRHLHPKSKRQPAQSLGNITSNNTSWNTQEQQQKPNDVREERHYGRGKKPKQSYRGSFLNQNDSGVDLDRICNRHDSIEELDIDYSDDIPQLDDRQLNHTVYNGGSLRKGRKQWTSEFVICAPSLDSKRTSNENNLDLSSLSLHGTLNPKTFGETIRGF